MRLESCAVGQRRGSRTGLRCFGSIEGSFQLRDRSAKCRTGCSVGCEGALLGVLLKTALKSAPLSVSSRVLAT